MQSVAVAIVHGIGNQQPNFAEETIKQLQKRTARLLDDRNETDRFQFAPVYWAKKVQTREDQLWNRMQKAGKLGWDDLREFMVSFASDAIAYQPIPGRRETYDDIHEVFAEALVKLAQTAGPRAPLCVIAHSLGTVIASNFLYDLQHHSDQKKLISPRVLAKIGDTPLSHGETLTLLFTLGCPVALWSLRYENFGQPVHVPSPKLAEYYPQIQGEWVNFYDEADIIGYPLKELNDSYKDAVRSDKPVRVGGPFRFWNPFSHTEYLKSGHVLDPVAHALVDVWRAANPAQPGGQGCPAK
jgi:hypothetical protein